MGLRRGKSGPALESLIILTSDDYGRTGKAAILNRLKLYTNYVSRIDGGRQKNAARTSRTRLGEDIIAIGKIRRRTKTSVKDAEEFIFTSKFILYVSRHCPVSRILIWVA